MEERRRRRTTKPDNVGTASNVAEAVAGGAGWTTESQAQAQPVTNAATSAGAGPVKGAINWGALLVLFMYSAWMVYRFQFQSLPRPISAADAGKRGFSELRAMKHVNTLTGIGPHPVGSHALDRAVKYVLGVAKKIQASASWDAEVEVDFFHSNPGAFRLKSSMFMGRTLIYGDLKHVVMRITPKHSLEAAKNALLISSHIDTVFSTEGAGDCSSCVAVMLELARAASNWAHGFRNAVIFLFNTGEEEGLDGAHSFITQHPWNSTIRLAVDLEAMGIGGRSSLFQGGPDPWIVEAFARVAKYPSAQSLSQDIFKSGIIKSATDFQIYREVAGLSGLDFAYMTKTATYHTKNDKLMLLTPGSLQHLGDNILPLLIEAATSPHLKNIRSNSTNVSFKELDTVYFDILGKYMVTYSSKLANFLYISIISQAVLIWSVSLYQGGLRAVVSLSLGCFSLLIMWVLSLSFSSLIALTLPHVATSPLPFTANPWLIVGLFGAPALAGALFGHHIGYRLLMRYLLKLELKRYGFSSKYELNKNQLYWIQCDAQRWLFKAGFVQWIIVLMGFVWANLGSAYIPFLWLVSPAVSYGLFEATLSPMRQPKELKTTSLIIGLIPPVILTAGNAIALIEILAGTMVRFDRNPGETPEWLATVIIAVLVAAVVSLLLVYHFPYAHLSGGYKWILIGTCGLLTATFAAITLNALAPFTEHIGRAVNVVQVVNVTNGDNDYFPQTYVSLYSLTPGKLSQEMESLREENFSCGRTEPIDFVTYSVSYGCVSTDAAKDGWNETDTPVLHVESDDIIGGQRKTVIFVDTKVSNRWVMAINSKEIRAMKFEIILVQTGTTETLVPEEDIFGVDGWHILQFVTEEGGPKKFQITLLWHDSSKVHHYHGNYLLKLRTDINVLTPKVARVMEKLPKWCVLFGKSTSPFTFSFIKYLSMQF